MTPAKTDNQRARKKKKRQKEMIDTKKLRRR